MRPCGRCWIWLVQVLGMLCGDRPPSPPPPALAYLVAAGIGAPRCSRAPAAPAKRGGGCGDGDPGSRGGSAWRAAVQVGSAAGGCTGHTFVPS